MTEITIEPLDRETTVVRDPLAGVEPRDLSGFGL